MKTMLTLYFLARWVVACVLLNERVRGWGSAGEYLRITARERRFWWGYFRGPVFYLAS